jgi:hypothetical protein
MPAIEVDTYLSLKDRLDSERRASCLKKPVVAFSPLVDGEPNHARQLLVDLRSVDDLQQVTGAHGLFVVQHAGEMRRLFSFGHESLMEHWRVVRSR